MKNLRQSKIWIVLISVLVLCLIAGAVTVLVLRRQEQVLEEQQNEALQELYDNQGRYDEQSIVLSNTTKPRAEELAKAFGADLRITEDGRFAALTLPEGVTVFDIYENEEYRKYIEYMSLDYQAKISDLLPSDEEDEEVSDERLPVRPQYTVSDTDYNRQTYLDYLNMSNVWNKSKGSGITVAVIDTGIDTDHPEFAGRISEYSYNASEDKIVKDYVLSNGSYDWSLVEDEQGHGTAVAGVIAASMNGKGVVGIAPQVNIIVIKAECDEYGNFKRTSDLVFGLYYAIERDVAVVNMSFGGTGNNPYTEAAQLAFDSDVICVAAAGNDATANLTYPAADENVFGVGALAEDSWELASYSNYGENVDFVAPGTVYTTLMGGGYGGMNGTSFASPITAGVLALYMSQNKYAEFNTVEELIYASCYDLGDLGPDWYYGYGALDVSALILEDRGTVTFNMMTDELDNTEQVFIRTHTLQNMPEPERLYAIFDGWYYDPQCTEEYVWYEDEFHSDLTLYANWVNEDDGVPYTYVELDDGTIEIRSYTGHRRYITIPDYIDGKVVSSIGEFAFKGETRLREVKLPKYLKRIRMSAFSGCSNLVSMEIPDTVTEIGANAFYDNVRLSTLTFGQNSQLVSIGDYAFSGCAKMRTFTVPSKVTTLNATAFYRNTAMIAYDVQTGNTAFTAKDSVLFNYTGSTLVCYPAGLCGTYTVPENVQTIGDLAFSFTRLSSVELSKVQSLGEGAFVYGALESMVIPDSVMTMGEAVFAYNSYLCSVKLGTGLTSIPSQAFTMTALTSIEFPASIRSIGDSAFVNIGSLAEITFTPDSTLTYIGPKAFFDSGVISIEIPASVVTIDSSAFEAVFFPYLTLLTFEENSALHTIGASAFAFQYQLTAVDLPDRLANLGDYSFCGTGQITVDIPASVSYFGKGAFASCHSLTDIFVDDANTHYLDVDGVVYNTEKTVLVEYPAGNTRTNYNILEGVTDIGEASFYGSIIQTVYCNQNLVTIHSSAFRDAFMLQNIYFQEGLKHIRPYAFYDTINIERIDLPNSVEVLDEYSFYGCGARQYGLSQNLREIKMYAISKNTRLTSIAIPDSVMQISNYAFAEDCNLRSVTFTENAKLPRISYGAFAYCGLTSFRVPANVSTIAQGAFMGCSDLQSFTFAENSKLESISAYMFDGCSNLRNITFEPGSALTSIQAHGLEGMRKLTTIDFGDAKLQNIDNFAFRFCESLTRFDIPEGVTFLGRYAFYYCTNLSEVTVPATMDFIGRFAFLGTKDLNVYFAAETLPAHLAEDWDHGTRGYYLGVTDVRTEGDWKYAKLTSGNIAIIKYSGTATDLDLTTLNLGGNIVNIGGSAFADSTVERIVLPETLQIIQAEAFYHSELKSVTIPASVTFIGREAFAYTPIESLTFAPNAQVKTIEQSAFEKTEKLGSVIIPASVTTMGRALFKSSGITSLTFAEGFSMTEIPEEAFAYTHISTVTIPDSVTLINHNAFRQIKELKSVILGRGADMMIMSNVFYQSGLETVYIPDNVGYVGEYAFVGLSNLTEFTVSANNPYYKAVDGLLVSQNGRKLIAVPAGKTGSLTVPKGIEVIGFGAFEDSKLSEIKFLDNANILSFGYRAFYNADGITEMHIPASVVAIDYYAFAMCDNLQKVTFAEDNNLKGVYEGAFYGCKNLSDIMLPDSIVEISDFAFYGCRKLTDVPVSETTCLKGIYDYAFAYAGFGGDYTTPETLIDIGPYAFMGNKFTSVTIPDTNYWDLIIGIGAFEDCQELTEITVPFIGASFEDDEITWFGYIFGAGGYEANATYVPKSLKKVNISEGITFVGAHAFDGLTGLEEMSIPHSVALLQPHAFNGTTARYELTNTITAISGYEWKGVPIYTASMGHFGTGLLGHLTLSDSMTSIDSAFSSCSGLTSITIPDSVTSIGNSAFSCCSSLTNITIPESVMSIGSYAFSDCSSLTSITIPDSVTSIGDYAFGYCSSLTSIEIPEGVTRLDLIGCSNLTSIEIPDGVTHLNFSGCSSLTSIEIPDGVTHLVFSGCSSLTSITIPDSVTGINQGAFNGCGSLTSIEIPDSVKRIGHSAFAGCSSLTSIIIPNGVTSIGDYAFYECNSLTRIDFRENSQLTNIGRNAFYNCDSLMSVEIPEGVTNIDYHAFYGCNGLTSITIPSSITSIGQNAFDDCTKLYVIYNNSNFSLECASGAYGRVAAYARLIIDKNGNKIYKDETSGFEYVDTSDGFRFMKENGKYQLIAYLGKDETVTLPKDINGNSYVIYKLQGVQNVIIPNGLTNIGDYAFCGCASLMSIEIPDSVTSISSSAFLGCPMLKLTVSNNNPNFSEINGVLYDKNVTRIIHIPAEIIELCIPKTVTNLSLTGNTTVQKVSFEENSTLTDISNSAFSGCSSLKSITIPDSVTSIGDYAFYSCESLTSIEIPDSVTSIGDYAFYSCESLTSIEISDSITSIGSWAFSDCGSLTSITIPESVMIIGSYAFSGCSSLTSITIPDSVTSIGSWAFGSCRSLTSIGFGENSQLMSIGEYVFCNCDSLTSIGFGENSQLASIGFWAFHSCDSLTSITIPSSVTSIGFSAFSGCSSLTSIVFGENSQLASIDYGVFSSCDSLTSITIPDSVTSIGDYAFSLCDNLSSIVFGENSQLTSIGDSAFGDCDSLTSIEIPDNVTSVSDTAFERCPSLKLTISANNLNFRMLDNIMYDKDVTHIIYVPESVTDLYVPKTVNEFSLSGNIRVQKVTFEEGSVLKSIDDLAFYNCDSLTSITIPNGVTSIGRNAFYDCDSLTSITIPDSVISIDECAFYDCDSLTSITIYDCDSQASSTIPENLGSIGSYAFYNCTGLTSIEIPEGVTSIGYCAFSDCSGLNSITIPSSLTSINNYAFSRCNSIYVIYNNSNLSLTFGSFDYGEIASHAKLIVDEDGNKMYRDEASGFEYVDTSEGFRFMKENGRYKLIAYLGKDDSITLPKDINGNSYEIYRMSGVRNVIIPDGVTSIGEFAFHACNSLTSITIPDSVTSIGYQAFSSCSGLTSITIPDSVTSIGTSAFNNCDNLTSITILGQGALFSSKFNECNNLTNISMADGVEGLSANDFVNTSYYRDSTNWISGVLYIDNHLIRVSENVQYLDIKEGIACIALGAYNQCYMLKNAVVRGDQQGILSSATNLETFMMTEMPRHYIYQYFGKSNEAIPLTLKTIVLGKDVQMRSGAFDGITGITIYVEANEKDVRWDENFPGWHNGNKVVYGDDWITAKFYDQNGNLMSSEIFLTSQVIRQPYLELTAGLKESQILIGWDIDGDGKPDSIPATSMMDIVAYPVIETKASEYTVTFFDADGVTLISKVILPYGAVIVPPAIEEKMGYTTNGWTGYTEGMTVSGNHAFVLDRTHNGDGHDYNAPVWVAPTCTEKGYNKHICLICGEWYATDEVEAVGHDYISTETAATCTEEGKIKYTCTACEHTYTEVIPAHGHKYVGNVAKNATCTKHGEILFICELCDDRVVEKTPMAAHNYQKKTAPKWWLQILIEMILNVFFGYEGDDIYYYECVDCKHIQTAEESSTGSSGAAGIQSAGCAHQLTDWTEYIAPTCEGDGVDAKFCTVCEKAIEFRRGEGAVGHDYKAVITVPTCTEKGYATHTCSRCGDTYTDSEVAELGHKPGAEADCLNDQVCTFCDEILVGKFGHDYNAVVTDPTCTEDGYTIHTCSRCGDTYIDSETEALGHKPGTEADCLNDQVCTVCDEILVGKFGHDYNAVVTDPTCTEQGYTTHTCSRCNDTYTDSEVAELGHKPGAEADCLNDQTCTVCGAVLVEKLGHDYNAVVTDPTCIEKGYTTHTCARCDDTYIDSEADALGHKPGEWIVDAEPTPGVEGSQHTECTVCGETLETAVIEALPVETEPETETSLETEAPTESDSKQEDPTVSNGCFGVVNADVFCLITLLSFACLLFAKRREENC